MCRRFSCLVFLVWRGCRGALDIFSQFFVSPLFTESSTGRELLAVDSEDSKNRTNDSRRILQVGRFYCVFMYVPVLLVPAPFVFLSSRFARRDMVFLVLAVALEQHSCTCREEQIQMAMTSTTSSGAGTGNRAMRCDAKEGGGVLGKEINAVLGAMKGWMEERRHPPKWPAFWFPPPPPPPQPLPPLDDAGLTSSMTGPESYRRPRAPLLEVLHGQPQDAQGGRAAGM